MAPAVRKVTLIGWGAIAQAVFARLQDAGRVGDEHGSEGFAAQGLSGVSITHVVVREHRVDEVQAQLGTAALVCAQVPFDAQVVLECAGHGALAEHVVPALRRGVPCAVLSVGALAEVGLPEQLEAAARQGQTQLHLLAGAIGGIDAIAAARLAGLTEVVYTGRKPPAGWRGSPAEQAADLESLTEPVVILQASAREAARLYPKNANVAATVSLAGLGLDATQVRLIADPHVTENIHEIVVRGVFGEMQLRFCGKPLPGNPKTSALTVLSALRFLHNLSAPITL